MSIVAQGLGIDTDVLGSYVAFGLGIQSVLEVVAEVEFRGGGTQKHVYHLPPETPQDEIRDIIMREDEEIVAVIIASIRLIDD